MQVRSVNIASQDLYVKDPTVAITVLNHKNKWNNFDSSIDTCGLQIQLKRDLRKNTEKFL